MIKVGDKIKVIDKNYSSLLNKELIATNIREYDEGKFFYTCVFNNTKFYFGASQIEKIN